MCQKFISTVLLFLYGVMIVTSNPSAYRSRYPYLVETTDVTTDDLLMTTEIGEYKTTESAITVDDTSIPEIFTQSSSSDPTTPSVTTEVPSTLAWKTTSGDASVSKPTRLTMAQEDPVFPIDIGNSCDKDLREIVFRGMACTCDVNSRYIKIRDDYEYTPGVGAYKLHTAGANFNTARRICNEEGAHLAIINSLQEEQILIGMFKAADLNSFEHVVSTGEARLGLHDLYKEGDWVTVLGDSVAKTGYNKWGVTIEGVKQPDNAGGEHCAVLMIHEDGNGMNDVKCQMAYPFFCEISEDNIH